MKNYTYFTFCNHDHRVRSSRIEVALKYGEVTLEWMRVSQPSANLVAAANRAINNFKHDDFLDRALSELDEIKPRPRASAYVFGVIDLESMAVKRLVVSLSKEFKVRGELKHTFLIEEFSAESESAALRLAQRSLLSGGSLRKWQERLGGLTDKREKAREKEIKDVWDEKMSGMRLDKNF